MHLTVRDLDRAIEFYTQGLGFKLHGREGNAAHLGAAGDGRTALFLAAGGYHHHIGLNTWAGVGALKPPPGAVGLRHFEINLPDAASLDQVVARVRKAGAPIAVSAGGAAIVDPSGNRAMLRVSAPGRSS